MKKNGFIRAWDIIYPILIYYVVSNVVMALGVLALGITEDTYPENYMMLQTIATAVSLPVIYGFYRKDRMMCTVFHQRTGGRTERTGKRRTGKRRTVLWAAAAFLLGALAGIVLNNLISATGLTGISAGYQEVNTYFYGGTIWFELLGVGILIPIAEELLYRGIVYARLSDWIGIPKAAVAASLIFGVLHMNLVQFVYASVMGMLLVCLLERTRRLYGAVLGHLGANLITVLRTETGFLDWMETGTVIYWISTVCMALVCAGILYLFKERKTGE